MKPPAHWLELAARAMDAAPDAILWLDRDGRIVNANRRATEILGHARDKLVSMPIHDIDSELSIERWSDAWKGIGARGNFTYESSYATHGERTIPVEVTASRLSTNDGDYCCLFVRDITHRKETEQMLAQMALRDPLSSVLNRRAVIDQLHRSIRWTMRYPSPLCVLLLDIDHLGRINDTLGRAVADQVLARAGRLISDAIRTTDAAGRMGGERFMIVMPETDVDGASVVAARLLHLFAERLRVPIAPGMRVTCSIGVAAWNAEYDSLESLLERTTVALEQAKQNGRNGAHVAGESEAASGDALAS